MTTPQPVRGTQSLLGEDADRIAAVIAGFDETRRLFGFKRVEVPTIESTQVFARTMGETTDVVSKEMYSFEDKSGESVTMRPEFTAGICRAFLSEGWQQFAPLKVATHGSAFRYERPQKGRFREFRQLDAEIIGAAEPQADVELLAFADQLLKKLGIEGVTLKLNTLGDSASRNAWRAKLIAHFEAQEISPESRERLGKNPLRVLDSKDPRDQSAVAGAPVIALSAEAEDFFGQVRAGLDAAGVVYELDPHLVRGLDYYRHTAFEFVTDRLGAQGTVIAGGRYDGLIESLGGPHTPAVGWAAGIERLAMMIDAPIDRRGILSLAIAPASSLSLELEGAGVPPPRLYFDVRLSQFFRKRGVAVEIFSSGKRDRRIKRARQADHDAFVDAYEDYVNGKLYLRVFPMGGPLEPIVSRIRQAVSPQVLHGASNADFILDDWR